MLFQSFHKILSYSFTPQLFSIAPLRINYNNEISFFIEKEDSNEDSYIVIKTTIKKSVDKEILKEFTEREGTYKFVLKRQDEMDSFSDKFKDFTLNLISELEEISTFILHKICWRNKIFSCPHKLKIRLYNLRWEEGEIIDPQRFLKKQYPRSPSFTNYDLFEGELKYDISTIKKVPLSFELYNEGVSIYDKAPRSSLIIFVAALETAIKNYITIVVPDSKWLVKEISSPPIVKLYSSYLKTLPAINEKIKNCFSVTKEVRKIIQKAVESRNDIVHGKEVELEQLFMKEVKDTTLELIYYIEWLLGEDWTFPFIAKDMQSIINEYIQSQPYNFEI